RYPGLDRSAAGSVPDSADPAFRPAQCGCLADARGIPGGDCGGAEEVNCATSSADGLPRTITSPVSARPPSVPPQREQAPGDPVASVPGPSPFAGVGSAPPRLAAPSCSPS